MNTEQLIEALLDPNSYPHPVEVITTIETHISIVFLTGQFAYKLKKPVDFGFLNFSTLENRKHFCKLEVSLNQRTAPELYLGVYEIHKCEELQSQNLTKKTPPTPTLGNFTITKAGYKDSSKTSQPIDYLVKMQQFNPNHVLGKMLKQDCELNMELLEKLAVQISQFHKNAELVKVNSEFGKPEAQLQPMLDNFPTLFKLFANDSKIIQHLKRLQSWTLESFNELKPTIAYRRKNGFVKACHGDLHLDNIAIINESPLLFDGIEFNDHFRWIDMISDIAFLLIDLEFRGKDNASYQTLSLYLSKTLDYKSLILLNFYRVYRTLVRAKITALRAQQINQDSYEQQQTLNLSQQYIQQAHSYILTSRSPKLILMQGVSGSGKSHLANTLQEQLKLNAIIISSDRIRKTLFGVNSTHRVNELEKAKLYSSTMNAKTYSALLEYAKESLCCGFNVIVDATLLKKIHRQKFYALASSINIKPYLISMQTQPEFAKKTIQLRLKNNLNPSDANVDIMLKQINAIDPPDASENAITLSSEQVWKIFPKERLQEFLELPID